MGAARVGGGLRGWPSSPSWGLSCRVQSGPSCVGPEIPEPLRRGTDAPHGGGGHGPHVLLRRASRQPVHPDPRLWHCCRAELAAAGLDPVRIQPAAAAPSSFSRGWSTRQLAAIKRDGGSYCCPAYLPTFKLPTGTSNSMSPDFRRIVRRSGRLESTVFFDSNVRTD